MIRGPVDKKIETNNKGKVSIKQPYHSIATEQMSAITKYQGKINQEARKELVFNKVTNPKVSEIQNKNDNYAVFKGKKKFIDQTEVSADQAEWNNFENKKKKMLIDNGVNPNPFSMLDDTSR